MCARTRQIARRQPTSMRLLLDECLPRKLKNHLPEHECSTVPEQGWAGKKNRELFYWRRNPALKSCSIALATPSIASRLLTPRSRSRTSSSNAGIAGTTVPMCDPSPRMWTSIPPAPSSTTFERRFIGGKTSMSYTAQLHRSIDSQVGHSSVVAKNGCSRCRPQR